MQFKKSLAVPLSLVVAAMLCSLALPPQEEKAKNLKVLPKNISHEELMKNMHFYNKALGVKCDFCHAKSKDNPQKMDFASDEKEEKETTREMMRMTNKINKKFFKSGKDESGQSIMTVSCYTCHNGEAEPKKLPVGGPEGAPHGDGPHDH
jgi:cytochrome c2